MFWKMLQSKGKERVICLTAERRTKRRGFKGSLHVCKVVSGTLEVMGLTVQAAIQPQWQQSHA